MVNELNLRRAYILGTNFEKRMFDVYEGMQNSYRPPYLDDLLTQGTGIQAALLLEQNKNLYQGSEKDIREWNELFNQVWDDDSTAKFEVLENLSEQDQRDIINDIFVYMDYNYLSYLVREHRIQPLSQAKLIHSPAKEIW